MRLRPAVRVIWTVIQRVSDDGFIHAGNLAYLSLTALFPIFILIASIAGALGRTDAGLDALSAFLRQLPPDVASVLQGPITDLLTRGSKGGLITIGILVGLWSVSGYIDTLRDIVLRAHGVRGAPMWKHRLMSAAGVILAVIVLILGFAAQFILVGMEQFVVRAAPIFSEVLDTLRTSRLLPALVIFLALNMLFTLLTPKQIAEKTREWPGALLTTLVWTGATMLLPTLIAQFSNYQLTYGSLAGVMISLLFFYVVGVGLVAGAQLNAVLAGSTPLNGTKGRTE